MSPSQTTRSSRAQTGKTKITIYAYVFGNLPHFPNFSRTKVISTRQDACCDSARPPQQLHRCVLTPLTHGSPCAKSTNMSCYVPVLRKMRKTSFIEQHKTGPKSYLYGLNHSTKSSRKKPRPSPKTQTIYKLPYSLHRFRPDLTLPCARGHQSALKAGTPTFTLPQELAKTTTCTAIQTIPLHGGNERQKKLKPKGPSTPQKASNSKSGEQRQSERTIHYWKRSKQAIQY